MYTEGRNVPCFLKQFSRLREKLKPMQKLAPTPPRRRTEA
jgi:hypothetical protein